MSFRVALIGCGYMARDGHGPAHRRYAAENPDAELVACCDTDIVRAQALADAYGYARVYTDYKEMISKEKPDAVCLAVPPEVTAHLAVAVMRLGVPLLVEKPPGRNAAECRQMIATATETGVPNQVAFNRRYTPLVRRCQEILTENFKPADLHHIHYDFQRVNRRDLDFSTTAIHGIDTVRFLARSPYKHVRFRYKELPQLGPHVANIYMDCVMESGCVAQLNFSPVAGTTIERATISAYNHTFFLQIPVWNAMDCPGRLLHVAGGHVLADLSGNSVSDGSQMYEEMGFYAENKAFFTDIRTGRTPAGDIESGLQSVEIAECIRERRLEYSRTIS